MFRDQAAMTQVMLGRGLSADEILCLHGRLDRPLVTAFLQAASRRAAGWTEGSVFLHVSSHGFFDGETAESARPGLLFGDSEDLADDDHLFWDDLSRRWRCRPGFGPRCCPTSDTEPAGGPCACPCHRVGMKAAPGMELTCRVHNLPRSTPAQPAGHFLLRDARSDRSHDPGRVAGPHRGPRGEDVRAGRLPSFYRPHLDVLGEGKWPAPGKVPI